MAECNFKPTLMAKPLKAVAKQKAEVRVNGLQRFYELRDLQRRQDAQKKQREAEVFGNWLMTVKNYKGSITDFMNAREFNEWIFYSS